MKKHEIQVGGVYRMKVSGTVQNVRVDAIGESSGYGIGRKRRTIYDCTNLATGRNCKAESATKFRGIAPGYKADGSKGLLASDAIVRGEPFAGGSVMTAPQSKVNSSQFGAEQTGFPEDGGTAGGPGFLPNLPDT